MTRYAYLLAAAVPAAVFTAVPVRESLKLAPSKPFTWSRRLFTFFNAVMLCEFCQVYTKFLTAPYELAAKVKPGLDVTLVSVSVYLLLSVTAGALFWKTLTVKLPVLMNEERIAGLWSFMFVVPLVMACLLHWMVPLSPVVVMTGRVRPISLVLVSFAVAGALMLCHMLWWITSTLTDSARLQQENTFLHMEARRYEELKNYMNYSREMRHNFRQHILVINAFAESGQLEELREYLSQFAGRADEGFKTYCANHAVDAVASYYDKLADSQDTRINWRLELPSEFPVKESDYCVILGNLTENALNAVKTLAPEKRKVCVMSSMLSAMMVGLSVDNEFEDAVRFGDDGLPLSEHGEGHGIGLASVRNIVNLYGGSMNITAEGNTFSVDIILYCNS